MRDIDRKKLGKAGYATPRGGDKGAYQNHVYRNNRVIIPYERLHNVRLADYADGYIIRLLPEQYFASVHQPKSLPIINEVEIEIGTNAFILYRTHRALAEFPPLSHWQVRGLVKNGVVVRSRGRGVLDTGHYVLRIPRHGSHPEQNDGAPQGIFAPEYANSNQNFLSQCVLAWLLIHSMGSPYTTDQANDLKEALQEADLL